MSGRMRTRWQPPRLGPRSRSGQSEAPAPSRRPPREFWSARPIGYRAWPPKTTMHTTLLFLLQDAAQAAGSQATPSPTSSLMRSLVPFLVIGVLFVFMLILPERKKQKHRQQMLDGLKKGDRVMTSSGMYGSVVTTTNDMAVLQVADNVRLRFSRTAIQSVLADDEKPALEEKAEPSKA